MVGRVVLRASERLSMVGRLVLKPPRFVPDGRAACPQAAVGVESRRVEDNAPYHAHLLNCSIAQMLHIYISRDKALSGAKSFAKRKFFFRQGVWNISLGVLADFTKWFGAFHLVVWGKPLGERRKTGRSIAAAR